MFEEVLWSALVKLLQVQVQVQLLAAWAMSMHISNCKAWPAASFVRKVGTGFSLTAEMALGVNLGNGIDTPATGTQVYLIHVHQEGPFFFVIYHIKASSASRGN